jgi:hypothetical protein
MHGITYDSYGDFPSCRAILVSPLDDSWAEALVARGVSVPTSRGRWPTVAEIRCALVEFPRREYRIVFRPKEFPDPGDRWYVSFDYSWDQDSDLRSKTVLRLEDRFAGEDEPALFRFDRGVPRVVFELLLRLCRRAGPMVVYQVGDSLLSPPFAVHAGVPVEQFFALLGLDHEGNHSPLKKP